MFRFCQVVKNNESPYVGPYFSIQIYIIADEPTGNLDNDNEETVFNLFKSLHQEGKTIIVITHNFHRAQEAVTQYQLENGQLHVKSH